MFLPLSALTLAAFTNAQDAINPISYQSNKNASEWITLNDILPQTDQNTGLVKCCPVGTLFDGKDCVFPNQGVCPPGFSLQNGACIFEKPIDCPLGSELVNGYCVTTAVTCPANSHFNSAIGKCIHTQDPTCAEGSFNGVSCVSQQSPQCAAGYSFDNGACTSQSQLECVQGTYFDMISKLCVHHQLPSCQQGIFKSGLCVISEKPKCPVDFTFQDNVCVSSSKPSCGPNKVFDGKVCRYESPPHCTSGVYENGFCVSSEKPFCSMGYHIEGDSCVNDKPPGCDSGYELATNTISGDVACCPFNMMLSGDICKSTPNRKGECPPGAQLQGNDCVFAPNHLPLCDVDDDFDGKRCSFYMKPCNGPKPCYLMPRYVQKNSLKKGIMDMAARTRSSRVLVT